MFNVLRALRDPCALARACVRASWRVGRGKSRARGVRAKGDAIRRRRAMDVDASNAARVAVRRVVLSRAPILCIPMRYVC